jgi:hypothetical protein
VSEKKQIMLVKHNEYCSVSYLVHFVSFVCCCLPLLNTDSRIAIVTLPSFFDKQWGCVLVYSIIWAFATGNSRTTKSIGAVCS